MFTDEEFDLMTQALAVLCATEPDKFKAANALHSKLVFNKEAFTQPQERDWKLLG
jgi:hypothetical protein